MIAPSQLPSLITTITTPRHAASMARMPRRRGRRADVAAAADVAIRLANGHDAAVLEQLEQLDDHTLPVGRHLVAEIDGVPVAAIAVSDGTIVADPFQPTSAVIDLLRLRARQMRVTA